MQMYKPFYTSNILFVIKLKYFLLYIYYLWFTISHVKQVWATFYFDVLNLNVYK